MHQALVAEQTHMLVDMVRQNTLLTEIIKGLTEPVEALTREVHEHVLSLGPSGKVDRVSVIPGA